jgi:hypothetical protein
MFVRHIKLILLLTGLGTLSTALFFLFPELMGPVFHIDLTGDAGKLLARHWALGVGALGGLLIHAAYHPAARNPILIAATVTKAGMVYLLLRQLGNAALAGTIPILAWDSVCVVLYVLYMIQHRRHPEA